MTRPVNIYLLSRIPGEDAFNRVFSHTAETQSRHRTALHEIESVRTISNAMIDCSVPVTALDGFFLGYTIPQIGKEFDLLKFSGDSCLNIELKSQPVPLEQMRAQLIRNRHYLSHLGRDMSLFTFVSDTRQCFRLEGDVLAPVTIADIAKAVYSFAGEYLSEIDGLFRPSEYIVSPSGTPEKFLNHEYFLTQAQDQIQKHLLAALSETTGLSFFSLTGKPGTGKTLLLYDVARVLSAQSSTAILHWGELSDGHEIINAADTGLTILPWAALDSNDTDQPLLAAYSYVLVDEAHRLTPAQFQSVCRIAEEYRQRVVFCLDPEQVLTTADRNNDIAGRVAALPLTEAFTLSERLRGNRELQAFIQEVRDLSRRPKVSPGYRDVDLGYAGTIEEARRQIAYYRDLGYVFINYYRNVHGAEPSDDNPFALFEGGYDIYHVIGQEFDRVVLLLDSSFCYTEDGKLEGVPRPDPDLLYPNLFYQSVTRVQEKLALIVLDNEPLFDRISGILR